MLPDLPDADVLIADKGYDSDWFREAELAPVSTGHLGIGREA